MYTLDPRGVGEACLSPDAHQPARTGSPRPPKAHTGLTAPQIFASWPLRTMPIRQACKQAVTISPTRGSIGIKIHATRDAPQFRCGQLFVFRQPSATRSRSTVRPASRCSSTISAASSARTFPYQTASGYTTIIGPCSHWSRHPDLLMRTRAPSPAALARCCSSVCRSLFPSDVQDGRGAPSGRVLWQTKIWRSKAGKRLSFSSSPAPRLNPLPRLIPPAFHSAQPGPI